MQCTAGSITASLQRIRDAISGTDSAHIATRTDCANVQTGELLLCCAVCLHAPCAIPSADLACGVPVVIDRLREIGFGYHFLVSSSIWRGLCNSLH